MPSKKNSFSLKRVLLPGIILQSVLIGGGYATGREIVEYGGKFGAGGWISGLAIFVGFSFISILSIEACRQWNVYDYKSLLKKMIGRAWIIYEIVYLMLAILIIAVMAAAAGEILYETVGFNKWIGVLIIVTLVGLLNYKGDEVIAKLETIGTIALFGAYILFAVLVFSSRSESILAVFSNWNTSYLPDPPSIGLLIWTGILYVGYNERTSRGLDDVMRILETTQLESIGLGSNRGLFSGEDSTRRFAVHSLDMAV